MRQILGWIHSHIAGFSFHHIYSRKRVSGWETANQERSEWTATHVNLLHNILYFNANQRQALTRNGQEEQQDK